MTNATPKATFVRFPLNWDVEAFIAVVSDMTGGNHKVKKGNYQREGKLPIIDQGAEFISGYTDEESLACDVPLPVILFGDHTRSFKFVTHPFALGADGVKVLVPKEGIDPRFLYYYLRQVRLPEDTGYSRHFKYLKESHIPVPPLHAQKRIAAILDKADAIRRKRAEAIRLTEDFLRSTFLEMFGEYFSKTRHLSRWKKIKEVANFIDYRGKTPKKSNDGIPLITAKNVRIGYISEEPREYISPETYDRWMTRGFPKEGDVLFTTEAPMGNVAKLGRYNKVAIAQRIITLQPFYFMTSDYIMHCLQHKDIQDKIFKKSTGSTVKGIRSKEFGLIEIPVPPLDKQEEFSYLSKVVEKISNATNASLSNTDLMFNSLVQCAFRGDL